MAQILPYKHAIATFGTAIAGLPSHIAYDSWPKIHDAMAAWRFHLTTLLHGLIAVAVSV